MRAVRRCAAVLVVVLCPAAPAAAADPVWVWPLAGERAVSRSFDPPATRYGPGHRGADLPAAVGTAVRAAGAGRVSYAGLLAGRGVVVIVHGAMRTTYEPVTAVVHVGQSVSAGQPIGRLAAGHCPTGCLHWGLLRGEDYLDPVQLVRRGPSRLLPVNASGPAAVVRAPAPPPAALPAAAPPAGPFPAGPFPAAASPAAVPVVEPAFAVRSADRPLGAAALVALLAGLALLVRPRRPPDGPAAPALAQPSSPASSPLPASVEASGLVDLSAERSRRRPDVA